MTDPTEQTEISRDWHLRLFSKSLLKQAKWRRIEAFLGSPEGLVGLDVGGDNGVISYLLRRQGGVWHSIDLDEKTVASIRSLVGDRVYRMENGRLPFEDGTFDVVVIIDMLEHLHDDRGFIAECHRVLKDRGRLIVNVPHAKRGAVLRPIRRLLGLTDELHGHVRPGYSESQLFDVLKDGFDVSETQTYSRFFVESVDTALRLAAHHLTAETAAGEKGWVLDAQDFQKMEKAFRLYAALYPVFWIAAQLDKLLFFTKGYSLIVETRRRPWRPRRTPRLQDGRSIAEATLRGKIGSAAPF